MNEVTFFVPGRPVAKERPRAYHGHFYTPARTHAYEKRIADGWGGREPFSGLVSVSVEARWLVPASWSKKRRKAAMEEPWYSGRPDGDNILKCILDGLTGTAYADDSAVVHAEITKHRTLDPDEVGCLITVREMAAC